MFIKFRVEWITVGFKLRDRLGLKLGLVLVLESSMLGRLSRRKEEEKYRYILNIAST